MTGPERRSPTLAAVALGSNLGDRHARLAEAVADLAEVGEVAAVSSVYESAPAGFADQPDFLNMVVIVRTSLGPEGLLDRAQRMEAGAGRRRTFPNAPRSLDVDIVLFGDRIVRSPRLRVPHPRWLERPFVLLPLREVAPRWVDPVSGISVEALAEERFPRGGGIRRVAPPPPRSAPSPGEGAR